MKTFSTPVCLNETTVSATDWFFSPPAPLACQLGSDGELCTRIITRRGAGEGISLDLISSFPLDRSLTKATSKLSESALISLKLLSPSCSGTRTPSPSTRRIFNFLAFSQQKKKTPKMCICWGVSQQKQQFGSPTNQTCCRPHARFYFMLI